MNLRSAGEVALQAEEMADWKEGTDTCGGYKPGQRTYSPGKQAQVKWNL